MPNARQTSTAALRPDAVLWKKMAAIHSDLDAVPEKGHDTVTQHNQFSAGIVGLRELAYVFCSCYWTMPPMVVRACRLLEQLAGPICLCEHAAQVWRNLNLCPALRASMVD